MPKKPATTMQLKVELLGSQPPIWRRLLAAKDTPLSLFHEILQISMGWANEHLYEFIAGGKRYGEPDPEFDSPDALDDEDYSLGDVLKRAKSSMIYIYDFGDSWEHKIILEKSLPDDPSVELPVLLEAAGACPPEDVGGVWGYSNVLEVLKDPKHEEYEDTLEWVGEDFDPKVFDMAEANEMLAKYCR